jgi:hypothetical protein
LIDAVDQACLESILDVRWKFVTHDFILS